MAKSKGNSMKMRCWALTVVCTILLLQWDLV